MMNVARLRNAASLVALVSLSWLAACSGGSSEPETGLVSTAPASGSQDAEPDARVTARFAEALQADTVTVQTFRVDRDGVPVEGSVSYDGAKHELRFSASRPLDMMASYQASLSDAILTADGKPIEATSWHFRTRDGQWQDGELLPQAAEPNFDREFGAHAYARDGSLWVIWTQHDEGWAKVFTSHRTSAGWSEPSEVAKVYFEAFELLEQRDLAPVIAINAQGAGIAVWLDPTRPDYDSPRADELWAARWDGTAWSAPERIGLLDGDANPPEVSIDDAGNALVVWRQSHDEGHDNVPFVAQRYVAGVGWQSPQELPASATGFIWSVHLPGDGTALVAWGEYQAGGISTARFSPATGWAAAAPVTSSGQASNIVARPRPDGSTVVTWTQSEGDLSDIHPLWFAIQRADGSWQAPAQLDADVKGHDLAVGPAGEARLAYTNSDGVLTRRLPADASEWLPVKQVASVDPRAVRLVLDDKGRGVMVFEELRDGSYRLWTSRLADPAGDAWSAPELTIDKPRTLRDLVGGPSGRAVLVMDTGDKVYADKRFE